MAMRELDRLKVIQAVIDGLLKAGRAAERLGLTSRQIQRMVNRVRTEGSVGVVLRRHIFGLRTDPPTLSRRRWLRVPQFPE
jgi:DNA-binding transcriptional regulator LsrR (DeoR family)